MNYEIKKGKAYIGCDGANHSMCAPGGNPVAWAEACRSVDWKLINMLIIIIVIIIITMMLTTNVIIIKIKHHYFW